MFGAQIMLSHHLHKWFWTLCFCLLISLNAEARTLSQNDVLQMSLSQSLVSQNFDLDKEVAKQTLNNIKSQYDTLLTSEFFYIDDQSARTNSIFGTQSTTTTFNFGVSQLTPLGTQLTMAFNNSRETTDAPFAAATELFESELNVGLVHPLLKNSFGTNTRKTVEMTKTQSSSQVQAAQSQILETAFQNVQLYWNWYYSHKAQGLQREAVYLAQKLYDTNLKKKKLGLIESSDLYAFAASLDLKKADLMTTKTQATTSTETLKSALNLQDSIEPAKESFKKQSLATQDTLVARALTKNPGLLSAKDQLKAQNITLAMSKNSKLPQVDLVGSLALNGIDTNYGDAVNNVGDYNPVLTAGVQVSFPLQNRSARSQKKTAVFQKQQALNRLKDTENRVISQVTQSYKNYKDLSRKVWHLSKATESQRLKWQGEVKKYNQGRSDPDLVIRYQDDYIQTRLLHLRAKVDMKIEFAKLQLALGSFESL